ncbi:hypothetical protein [Streptomyces sp. Qhu_M48]|uniref:hypothetical protein n=1 Tax=Streptomyces sp. Qhu_M48 TaxID=3435889 RepID=UPI003F4FF63C
MNPTHTARSVNHNLFEGLPVTVDILQEYHPDVTKFVREAAIMLHTARRTGANATFEHADRLTPLAASVLRGRAEGHVSVRCFIVIAARLVELEAAALAAQEEDDRQAHET